MKSTRQSFAWVGLGVTLVAIVIGAPPALGASPRLRIDSRVHDFGSVTNQLRATHDFIIRNAGDADLEINRVVSGCDACLHARLDRTRLQPNTSTVLHSRLDLTSLEGTVVRTISLHSNDPQQPILVLGVTGVVHRAYEIVPNQLQINMAEGQRSAVANIIAFQNLHAPLLQAQCDDTNIVISVSLAASNRYFLKVIAPESFPTGRSSFNITLRSADSNDPPCWIEGFVYNPPDLEILPASLQLEAKADPQLRILWIKQRGPKPAVLLDAIPPSNKFHCEIDPDPASHDYRIYITARQQDATGGGSNVVLLKMRNHRQEEQTIPVTVSVARTKANDE